MATVETTDFHAHLPPYRSLLTPNARYDYKSHKLIPISQNELNSIRLINAAKNNSTNTESYIGSNKTSKIKMKYKSLLSDVSRRTSLLSMKINNASVGTSILNQLKLYTHQYQHPAHVHKQPPIQFKNLPIEILIHIFNLVDDFNTYKVCLFVNKQFYQLSKPFLYANLTFSSTYRFSQFITYLRLNSDIGYLVQSIDLSNIKPGNFELEEYENALTTNHHHHHQNHHQNHNHNQNHNHQLVGVDENIERVRSYEDNRNDGQFENSLTTSSTLNSLNTSFNQPKILAGWRDWKYKNNPLYTVHHPSVSSNNLTKIASNSQISNKSMKSLKSYQGSLKSNNSINKMNRLSKFLKSRKRHRSDSLSGPPMKSYRPPKNFILDLRQSNCGDGNSSYKPISHPSINKFLLNYSNSKDIPIGYILHLINLCPNLNSLNLGNLSLSIDYEINKSMIYKYQNFDLMNNYPKDIVKTIDSLFTPLDSLSDIDSCKSSFFYPNTAASIKSNSINNALNLGNEIDVQSTTSINPLNQSLSQYPMQDRFFSNNLSSNQPASSASSLFSIPTFSKPIIKYNSLLPPLPATVNDISYMSKGDGKVYLSDLNLKSINNKYLSTLNEEELLSAIIKIQSNKAVKNYSINTYNINNHYYRYSSSQKLKYINLSSMIWLNKKLVQIFLQQLLKDQLQDSPLMSEDSSDFEDFSDDESIITTLLSMNQEKLVIDLTDSGMYKNLQWATLIDLNKKSGQDLANKIINNELLDSFEDFMRRERIRRGLIGENFLH